MEIKRAQLQAQASEAYLLMCSTDLFETCLWPVLFPLWRIIFSYLILSIEKFASEDFAFKCGGINGAAETSPEKLNESHAG